MIHLPEGLLGEERYNWYRGDYNDDDLPQG